MTPPTLPNELLAVVFSHLSDSSSKSTLLNVSLTSRAFYKLAKPSLYHTVTIQTGRQRRRLKRVSAKNVRLVKKLVINGTPLDFYDVRPEAHVIGDGDGHDCLVELFQGTLLDISTLEVLHVRYIRGVRGCLTLNRRKIKAAPNLVEISIRSHSGGGELWEAALARPSNHPRLARAAFSGVSYLKIREKFLNTTTLVPRLASQLEVLVVADGTAARRTGYLEGSGLLVSGNWLKSLVKGWIANPGRHLRLLPNPDFVPSYLSEIAKRLRTLLSALRTLPRYSTYLSLPYSHRELTSECKSILSELEELGVEVHLTKKDDDDLWEEHWEEEEREGQCEVGPEDSEEEFNIREEEEDAISLIPRSFVDFLARQKRKEIQKGKQRSVNKLSSRK
ncbi:uncharacterized protein JCM6883_000770 [Sporobolomyces salmoneus]|uniref:uncharacterized protein n=1 Tax=Sporobolomyces salmoneus TaxID=183962 RepID=UPI00317F891B